MTCIVLKEHVDEHNVGNRVRTPTYAGCRRSLAPVRISVVGNDRFSIKSVNPYILLTWGQVHVLVVDKLIFSVKFDVYRTGWNCEESTYTVSWNSVHRSKHSVSAGAGIELIVQEY